MGNSLSPVVLLMRMARGEQLVGDHSTTLRRVRRRCSGDARRCKEGTFFELPEWFRRGGHKRLVVFGHKIGCSWSQRQGQALTRRTWDMRPSGVQVAVVLACSAQMAFALSLLWRWAVAVLGFDGGNSATARLICSVVRFLQASSVAWVPRVTSALTWACLPDESSLN